MTKFYHDCDDLSPPTYIVKWYGSEYTASIEGRDEPTATGRSAEEALLKLREEMKRRRFIAEAWKDE